MKHILLLLVLMLNKDLVAESSCRIGNTHDSYVLAVTWHAGFCLAHEKNAGCKGVANDVYARENFTLHGLWPNKIGCQQNYAFCDAGSNNAGKLCSLPPVGGLSKGAAENLHRVMPSAREGGCLDRHEWWKHGTCSGVNEDAYFTLSISLLDKFNASDFVTDFVRNNLGKAVSRRDFFQRLDQSFGLGAHDHVLMKCGKGGKFLEEIQIQLPREIGGGEKFGDSMRRGNSSKSIGNCKEQFKIASLI